MNHLEIGFSQNNKWYNFIGVISSVIGTILLVSFLLGLIFIFFLNDPDYLTHLSFIESLIIYALIPFLFLYLISLLVIKELYKINFQEVVNGTKSLRWGRIFFGMLIWGLLSISQILIGYIVDADNFIITLNYKSFLYALLLSMIVFPIQASWEEFFFRGYLAQVFAGWTNSRVVSIIIPSILFGLLHSANPEVFEYGFFPMMIQYIGLGIIFGLTSAFDDGIELAIGAHIINNILSSILVSFKGSALENPGAIFYIKNMEAPSIFGGLMFLIIIGGIFIGVCRNKYKWKTFSCRQKNNQTTWAFFDMQCDSFHIF